MIMQPAISSRFIFKDHIGSGSQATVDHYIQKIKNNSDLSQGNSDSFAVKTYRINENVDS